MCTVYDNTWIIVLGWAKLAVLVLATMWIAYRSGMFADLLSLRRRATLELALADDAANLPDEPLTA